MVKSGYTSDLKSDAKRHAGSSPAGRTTMRYMVAYLKLYGMSTLDIAERLQITPNSVYCHWWRFKNPDKYEKSQQDYWAKSKEKQYEYTRQWRKDNPEAVKEYYWRAKCKEAGIDWRKG